MSKLVMALVVPATLLATADAAHASPTLGHHLNADTPADRKAILPPDTTPAISVASSGPIPNLGPSTFSGAASASSSTGIFRADIQATLAQPANADVANWGVGAGILEPIHLTGGATGIRARLTVSHTGSIVSAQPRDLRTIAQLKVGECLISVTFHDVVGIAPIEPEANANCRFGTASYADGVLTVDWPDKNDTEIVAGLYVDFKFGLGAFVGTLSSTTDTRLSVTATGGSFVGGSPGFLEAADGGSPAGDAGTPVGDAGAGAGSGDGSVAGGAPAPPSDEGTSSCAMHPAGTAAPGGAAFALLATLAWLRRRRARVSRGAARSRRS